jgi:hypothetical protein
VVVAVVVMDTSSTLPGLVLQLFEPESKVHRACPLHAFGDSNVQSDNSDGSVGYRCSQERERAVWRKSKKRMGVTTVSVQL